MLLYDILLGIAGCLVLQALAIATLQLVAALRMRRRPT